MAFKNYYQFNEALETKEEFEKQYTHYIAKDIPGKEKLTGLPVIIKDGFGRNIKNPSKIQNKFSMDSKRFQNEIQVREPDSYHSHNRIFHMSDEDVEKYFKVITSTYRSSKKYGL